MDSYGSYEKECDKIRKVNVRLLQKFSSWMKSHGLSPKTIDKHLSNIDFYINEYLLYEDATEANTGVGGVDMFLGYWFIKKATWASESAIKANASSLKKFYKFMLETGKIEESSYAELVQTIKDEMPEWIETVTRYDDPSITDMGEVWGV